MIGLSPVVDDLVYLVRQVRKLDAEVAAAKKTRDATAREIIRIVGGTASEVTRNAEQMIGYLLTKHDSE